MLNLISLELKDFCAFEHTILEYSQTPGLVLVRGIYEGSDSADSNMSGKTTLMTEGLLWALYGSVTKDKGPSGATINQARANDVIRKGCSACEAVLTFELSGEEFRIRRRRTQTSHKLELLKQGKAIKGSSVDETQKQIDALVEMGYNTFTQTVLFGQGSARFIQARDADRKKIVEELLGIEVYRKAQKAASRLKLALSSELDVLSYKQKDLQSSINHLESFKEGLEEDYRKAKEEYDKKEELLKAKQAEYAQKLDELYKQKKELNSKHDRGVGRVTELAGEVKDMPSLDDLERTLEGLAEEIVRTTDKLRRAEEEILHLSNQSNMIMSIKTCPTCQQDMSNDQKQKLANALTTELEKTKADKIQLNKALKEYKDLQEKMRATKSSLVSILDKVKEAETEHHRLEMEISNLNTEIKNVQEHQAIAAIMPDSPPSRDKIKDIEERLKVKRGEQEDLNEKKKSLDQQMKEALFWVEGFGPRGIPSLLLDNVLPVLNKSVNDYLGDLLHGTVRLEFDTQSFTDKGEAREQFDVRIEGEGGSGYHLASAGERGRIDFAVALALQKLQVSRGGRCNLYICDEPFESLDASGVEHLMHLLRRFAYENKLCIYVITHRTELKSLFDETITVVKKEGVSSLEG